jgi:hypothetical protein
MGETFWGLTGTGWTAIGSIVGAISILVLSILNGFALSAARRSAEAASQQAQIAKDSLKELQRQFMLQQLSEKEMALASLMDIARNAENWKYKIKILPETPNDDTLKLMPDNWGKIMAFIVSQVPDANSHMLRLGSAISDAELLLNQMMHTPLRNRVASNSSISVLAEKTQTVLDQLSVNARGMAETLRAH